MSVGIEQASAYVDMCFHREPSERFAGEFPLPCGNCKNFKAINKNLISCAVYKNKAARILNSGGADCNTVKPIEYKPLEPEPVPYGLFGTLQG